jgi:serine/threonine-protein kinase HipA
MNRCPITYELCGDEKYSFKGLKLLSNNLKESLLFPYTAQEQLALAAKYATKLSIQGVQPKLSVKLNAAEHCFEIVESRGTFIIKPQHPFFNELPQNEDLTMRLASMIGLEVPLHGMVYGQDGSLSYFIKRFDRYGHSKKLAVEDFAQLSNASRQTKYDSSMEKLIPIIEEYCSFPILEKLKLFKITLFCFLVGNDDMHLKNFSIIRRPQRVELTPAYDLVNSSIVLRSNEEIALPLKGKKSNLRREHLVDYYGRERLNLNSVVIDEELARLQQILPEWISLINKSFLSKELQHNYIDLLQKRYRILDLLL